MSPTAKTGKLNETTRVALVLAVFFFLKIGALVFVSAADESRFEVRDTLSYVDPARTLVQAGVFSVSPVHPDTPETVRTPGYPLMLALVYSIFGERHFPVVLAQIILSTLTIGLVYFVARQVGGPRVALIAAFLYSLDVVSFAHTFLLLSETVFTLFLTAAVASGVMTLKDREQKRWPFLFGLSLAAATLVRPVTFYLALAVIPGLLLAGILLRWRWKASALHLCLAAVPIVLLLGGWMVRNYQVTGTAVLSQIEGINFVYYRGADIVARRDGISLDEARGKLGISDPWRTADLQPEAGFGQRWANQGMDLIRAHPVLFLQQQALGVASIMATPGDGYLSRLLGQPSGDGPLGDLRRLPPASYVHKWVIGGTVSFVIFTFAVGYLFALYAGVAYWVGWTCRRRLVGAADILIWVVLLYVLVISAGPEGYFRFRVPIMPLLAIYAAQGLLMFRRAASPRGATLRNLAGAQV